MYKIQKIFSCLLGTRFFLFPFLLLSFHSCVDIPDKLVIPEWDVELNVPIINKDFTIKEIVKSQQQITIDTSSNIFLLQSGNYNFNTSTSGFVQLDEASSLENIPVMTSNTDSFEVSIPFPDGVEVESALIDEGIITLSAVNPTITGIEIVLILPGFKDFAGNDVILQLNADAGQSNSLTYSLSGNSYNVQGNNSSNLRNFKVILKALSSQPGEVVLVGLSLSDLSFNFITGKIPTKSIGIHTSNYNFDVNNIEEYRDKVKLRDAKLDLKVLQLSEYNTPPGVEVKNLNIIGFRNDGGEIYLRDNSGNPNFNFLITNESFQTNFTNSNSNITDFITYLPDSITIIAEYFINPENNNGTFSKLDSIKAEAGFSTLSYIALDSITITDEERIVISEVDREDIRKGSLAEVQLEIENHIPVSAWLKVDLIDINGNYLFTITHNNGSDFIPIEGAEIDENGEVVSSFINPSKTIILNEQQVQMFSNAYRVNYRIGFSTKNYSLNPFPIVAIRPLDRLKIKAIGKIRYRIDDLN